MDPKRPLFFISLAAAGLTLMGSFCLARQVPLALAVLLPAGAMGFARKPGLAWLAPVSLYGFTILAAAGIVLHLPALPLVLASSAALASWDLALEIQRLEIQRGIIYGGSRQDELYERLHLKSLGAAIGLGLLGAGIGPWIHWQSPFAGMVGLVLAILFCLGKVLDYSQRHS